MIPTISKSSRKLLCDSCRAKFPGKTPSLFAKQLKKQRKEKQEQERLTKKGARAAVRAACVKRANGYCEDCGLSPDPGQDLEMDHFYGRARSESVETCWMLCRRCHREKTENDPTRMAWDFEFAAHTLKYGYPYRERFGGRPKADARNEPPDSNPGARESR